MVRKGNRGIVVNVVKQRYEAEAKANGSPGWRSGHLSKAQASASKWEGWDTSLRKIMMIEDTP